MISENKKALDKFVGTGTNQGRLYAIAGVRFYASLGVYGVPVYILITEGPVVAITVALGEEWDTKKTPLVISKDVQDPPGTEGPPNKAVGPEDKVLSGFCLV